MIVRWIRRLFGVVMLAWAAWQVVAPLLPRRPRVPLYGVDRATGEVYGVRITPLSRAEAEAALVREREAFATSTTWG